VNGGSLLQAFQHSFFSMFAFEEKCVG